VRILSALVKEDNAIGSFANGNAARGATRYWSVLRRANKSFPEIVNFARQLAFCQVASAQPPVGDTPWAADAVKTEAYIRGWAASNDDYAILVDKLRYDLYVFLGAQVIARLPVELGLDPVTRKEREGDRRTPEGVYSVVFRREQGGSFYKDFMLDYPNADDRHRGRTGSAIEIHGSGSGRRPTEGGRNWTFGCVALSNDDVDRLFGLAHGAKRIRKGTPVGIVHSLAHPLPVIKAALP
jgi:hypothetical protein